MIRVAAAALWKYTDHEGRDFYLDEKKATLKSPYDGKVFSAKPQRVKAASDPHTVEAGKKMPQIAMGALTYYAVPDSEKGFWLPEKKGRVFSPWNGQPFKSSTASENPYLLDDNG